MLKGNTSGEEPTQHMPLLQSLQGSRVAKNTANSWAARSDTAKQSAADSTTHINMVDAELGMFRTRICEQHRNGNCHNSDRCPHSHCQTWQRRNPGQYNYSSKLCPEIEFVKKGNKMTLVRRCSRGRGCMFAHSKEEELYHPTMYKTKMCNAHPHCTRYFCPFAHHWKELRKPQNNVAGTVHAVEPRASVAAAVQSPNHAWGSAAAKGTKQANGEQEKPGIQKGVHCPGSPTSSSTTASSSLTSPSLLTSPLMKLVTSDNVLRVNGFSTGLSESTQNNLNGCGAAARAHEMEQKTICNGYNKPGNIDRDAKLKALLKQIHFGNQASVFSTTDQSASQPSQIAGNEFPDAPKPERVIGTLIKDDVSTPCRIDSTAESNVDKDPTANLLNLLSRLVRLCFPNSFPDAARFLKSDRAQQLDAQKPVDVQPHMKNEIGMTNKLADTTALLQSIVQNNDSLQFTGLSPGNGTLLRHESDVSDGLTGNKLVNFQHHQSASISTDTICKSPTVSSRKYTLDDVLSSSLTNEWVKKNDNIARSFSGNEGPLIAQRRDGTKTLLCATTSEPFSRDTIPLSADAILEPPPCSCIQPPLQFSLIDNTQETRKHFSFFGAEDSAKTGRPVSVSKAYGRSTAAANDRVQNVLLREGIGSMSEVYNLKQNSSFFYGTAPDTPKLKEHPLLQYADSFASTSAPSYYNRDAYSFATSLDCQDTAEFENQPRRLASFPLNNAPDPSSFIKRQSTLLWPYTTLSSGTASPASQGSYNFCQHPDNGGFQAQSTNVLQQAFAVPTVLDVLRKRSASAKSLESKMPDDRPADATPRREKTNNKPLSPRFRHATFLDSQQEGSRATQNASLFYCSEDQSYFSTEKKPDFLQSADRRRTEDFLDDPALSLPKISDICNVNGMLFNHERDVLSPMESRKAELQYLPTRLLEDEDPGYVPNQNTLPPAAAAAAATHTSTSSRCFRPDGGNLVEDNFAIFKPTSFAPNTVSAAITGERDQLPTLLGTPCAKASATSSDMGIAEAKASDLRLPLSDCVPNGELETTNAELRGSTSSLAEAPAVYRLTVEKINCLDAAVCSKQQFYLPPLLDMILGAEKTQRSQVLKRLIPEVKGCCQTQNLSLLSPAAILENGSQGFDKSQGLGSLFPLNSLCHRLAAKCVAPGVGMHTAKNMSPQLDAVQPQHADKNLAHATFSEEYTDRVQDKQKPGDSVVPVVHQVDGKFPSSMSRNQFPRALSKPEQGADEDQSSFCAETFPTNIQHERMAGNPLELKVTECDYLSSGKDTSAAKIDTTGFTIKLEEGRGSGMSLRLVPCAELPDGDEARTLRQRTPSPGSGLDDVYAPLLRSAMRMSYGDTTTL